MYICTQCLETAMSLQDIKHIPSLHKDMKELKVMRFRFFLRGLLDRIDKMEQNVASIKTDLQQTADLLRKYSKP